MAHLNAQINTGAQPKRDHGELIPNGTWLLFELIEADVLQSTTVKGDWEGVKYTAKAVSDIPENQGFYGRQIWGCITTSHTGDTKAQAWGLEEMGELGRALGIPVVSETEQLLGKDPFWGRVGIKPPSERDFEWAKANGKPEPDPKNIIREYRAYGDKRPRGKAPPAKGIPASRDPGTPQVAPARVAAARPAAPAPTSWRDRQKNGPAAAAASTAVHEPLDDAIPF